MFRVMIGVLCVGITAFAASSPYDEALERYQRTDYRGALKILNAHKATDARSWELAGQSYFMMADYKKATDAFEKAVSIEPRNSEYMHWLGRAWGRRAESANPFSAPVYASRARGYFETAVQLNAANKEALNDLFDYYLEAPGFLGGGLHKASALVDQIAKLDTAEGQYAQAQLADKQKQFDQAEQHLRWALEIAPRQVGRVIDLAKYLSKRGRVQESDAVFAQAEKMAPNDPQVLYYRAETYIRDNRNLEKAKELLNRYLRSTNLTPDDPPRSEAEELLKKLSG